MYCGQVRPTTSEHFVPRSLFDKKPQQAWTIAVCDRCNQQKASSDDYLRDMLVADDSCGWHPVTQAVMRKMLRSARYGSSRVANATRNAKQSAIFSPGGVYMGDLLAVPLEDARLARIFTWLTRGAYFYFLKQRFPTTTPSSSCVWIRRVRVRCGHCTPHEQSPSRYKELESSAVQP